jgi:hypothetical protein
VQLPGDVFAVRVGAGQDEQVEEVFLGVPGGQDRLADAGG